MLKYRYVVIISVLALLIGAYVKNWKQAVKYKRLYDTAESNILAYEADLDSLKQSSRMYYLTIDQLKTSNDSLLRKTVEYAKELKIKQKTIQNISYQTSEVTKTDTVYVQNVIKENARLDTLLSDRWYSLRLKIAHPDTVIITPDFKSQRFAYITAQREIKGKPSKWFFIRWFQKRHTVITVDVHEENPYIDIKQQKFVEIIK